MQQKHETTLGRALQLSRLLVSDRLLNWRPANTNQLVWTIRGLIVLGLLIAISSAYDKGIWDWLDLLIVPAAIAVGVYLLAQAQQAREKQAEDERRSHEQEMEDRQREQEQEFENQRAQNTAVQAYIDNMGTLMLEGDLRRSREESDVRVLARARTLTVLEGLDAAHKRFILQFLYESNLINHKKFVLNLGGISWEEYGEVTGQRIIGAADFATIHLENYRLPNISLSYVDLRNVYFKYVDLHDACLQGADLRGATFWISKLDNAMLAGAHLEEASLGYSSLEKANLREANLYGAHLHGANLSGADLSGANLINALGLYNVQLDGAQLKGALLVGATLSWVNLSGADLSGANLTDVVGVQDYEIEQQVKSLEGATMPNGQKYEDWLKSKSSREDG